MKKIFSVVTILLMMMSITACSKKTTEADETFYVGINAEILEISNEINGMVVKFLDNDCEWGTKCYVNCESKDTEIIYVDFDTLEITKLNFEDLEVGDEITIDIGDVEDKYVLTKHIQLQTQRL